MVNLEINQPALFTTNNQIENCIMNDILSTLKVSDYEEVLLTNPKFLTNPKRICPF